ncbi:hypothetical protein ACFQ51_47000 [Streptomyces kaempferi]
MFNFGQDHQNWTPSATWLWNLRTQISANMSSANFALNIPIFNLYQNNLLAIEAWTKQQMGGLAGACVPEVMRFNGNGGDPSPGANAACSQPGSPNWNALDVTSGAEMSLYVWQQYQDTGDLNFLRTYYPLMRDSATFLLAYQKVGSDGKLHAVANAHETQWAVQDPTTDLAADAALFPAVVSAAKLLNTDTSLQSQLTTALGQIPPWARTDYGHTQVLPPSADSSNNDVIAWSYQPTATVRNGENIDLEPVWPYNLITGDPGALHDLAVRTYNHRVFYGAGNDWNMDAIDAARLGMASEVASRLVAITQAHQVYINGLSDLGSTVGTEGYIEQVSGVATALNEALVQDYDGTLRVAPAWPGLGCQRHRRGAGQHQGERAGAGRQSGHRGHPGRFVTDDEGPHPLARQGGSGRERLQQRGGGLLHHRRYLQRAGSLRPVLPGRAGRSPHHGAALRTGLRVPGDHRQTPGHRTDRHRRQWRHARQRLCGLLQSARQRRLRHRRQCRRRPTDRQPHRHRPLGAVRPDRPGQRLRRAPRSRQQQVRHRGQRRADPLLAKVNAVGTWEQFQLIHNGDGSVSLKSMVNGDYVTAENAAPIR